MYQSPLKPGIINQRFRACLAYLKYKQNSLKPDAGRWNFCAGSLKGKIEGRILHHHETSATRHGAFAARKQAGPWHRAPFQSLSKIAGNAVAPRRETPEPDRQPAATELLMRKNHFHDDEFQKNAFLCPRV